MLDRQKELSNYRIQQAEESLIIAYFNKEFKTAELVIQEVKEYLNA